ncbi:MAG: DUF262 domain-containing protein [Clostridium sp.]|uniref:DUF262 domain-containing protein n=1 Tax=Clostridium sp. TaxID=1506 RepID=UPI0025B7D7E5|nr:DUF262 domain-containing protein [Clostridium sp.]MCE5220142.1 DUF262 domain-containing protein [Clostridium sp.]
MQRKSLSWSVKQVNTMINKESIIFDNPVQRPAGQWKDEDKSLLIHSTLEMFVPDIYAIQEKHETGNTYSIIDGLQRLTIIHSFLNDEWALTELPQIRLESTGEKFNISGKKFTELPEEVQDEIKGFMLSFKLIELEEDDDEESIVNDIFYRLNNGKPVSKEHLALVSAKKNIQEFVHKIITEHKLFTDVAHFTNNAVKKSDKQMTVLQSIILVSGLEYNTFNTKDVEKFFMQNDITDEVLNRTEELFTTIASSFGNEYNKFCTKINIVSMVGFLNSLDNQEQIKSFLTWYPKNSKPGDVYKNNCGAGSTKKERINGRINGLKEIYDNWIKDNFKLTA